MRLCGRYQLTGLIQLKSGSGYVPRGCKKKPHTKMRTDPPTAKPINFTTMYYSTTSISSLLLLAMDSSDQCNHYDTPNKAKVRGAVEFLEAKGIPHFKSEVFDHFIVKHRQGWAMISEASEDRRHRNTNGEEHRGRPRKITNQQLKEMDRIICEEGFEAWKLSWEELGWEAGVEGVTTRTIPHAMGNTMSYSKCIACQKKWCNPSTAKARKA
jgi:hypothetical protein